MIIQSKAKISCKDAVNEISNNIRIPYLAMGVFDSMMETHFAWDEIIRAKKLGAPNSILRGYESNPGMWIFYDLVYNITFYVFSDVHRKNAFKGTSWEVPGGTDQTRLPAAFARLTAYVKSL